MSKTEQLKETDITELVKLAREEVSDNKIISWIIDHSPYWRGKGYSDITQSLKDADIELEP